MNEEKGFVLTPFARLKLTQYLSKKPYEEVSHFITMLNGMESVDSFNSRNNKEKEDENS